MRRIGLVALAAAGIAAGLGGEYFSVHAHTPENHWLDLAVGLAYLGAGLIALARSPRNRVGWLMVAFGLTWFIGNFGNAKSPLLVSLGTAYQSLSAAFLAHLVLAYPDGRLTRRSERVVVAAIYLWTFLQGTVIAVTFDPRRLYGCGDCPSGALAIFPSRHVYDAADKSGNIATALFAAVVLALVIRRFLRAGAFARRDLAPLWIGSALVATAFVLEGISGAAFRQNDPAQQLLVDAQKVTELLVPLTFLVGLLRSRLAESSVARLVVALGRPLRRGELREVLARALGDPSLRLAFSVPGGRGFVDEDGSVVQLPRDDPERTTTFVEDGSAPIAALIHDRALRERQPLVDAVGAAARLALQNERLQAEIRGQLEEVRASRARIVAAADAERQRIERNLHDGAQQRLVTLSLQLALAREQAATGTREDIAASLSEAADDAAAALTELRELGRGLHPSILTEAGLGPALKSLAERAPVPTRVKASLGRRLPEAVEVAAYFVVAEALANVGKHASASRAEIEAELNADTLVVAVSDDGTGGANANGGTGLRGLADRIAALDGALRIDARPGAGTRIEATLPCA
jgi:signal transduction histidine kinase